MLQETIQVLLYFFLERIMFLITTVTMQKFIVRKIIMIRGAPHKFCKGEKLMHRKKICKAWCIQVCILTLFAQIQRLKRISRCSSSRWITCVRNAPSTNARLFLRPHNGQPLGLNWILKETEQSQRYWQQVLITFKTTDELRTPFLFNFS